MYFLKYPKLNQRNYFDYDYPPWLLKGITINHLIFYTLFLTNLLGVLFSHPLCLARTKNLWNTNLGNMFRPYNPISFFVSSLHHGVSREIKISDHIITNYNDKSKRQDLQG